MKQERDGWPGTTGLKMPRTDGARTFPAREFGPTGRIAEAELEGDNWATAKPVILVPTDLSAESLRVADYALQMAVKNDALFLLVHVVHLNLSAYGPANPQWIKTALCQEAVEKTTPLMHRAHEAGVPALCAIEEGAPWSVVTKLAARWKASMIVLAGSRGGLLARIFGRGTVNRIVRATPCPVLLCPTGG